jgi:hypothetical protein
MERFLTTITASRKGGIADSLRIPENFFASSLADGYSIANWQYDQAVPIEKRRFFGLLATKSPYLDGLLGERWLGKTEQSCKWRFSSSLA